MINLSKYFRKSFVRLKRNNYFLYLSIIRRIIKQKKFKTKFKSDKRAIEYLYKSELGHELNLENPVRFTEKIQWLKLYYHNNIMHVCVDKYTVREYLIQKGYKYLLNDLICVWDDPSQIDLTSLPEKFVIKATHGSSMNLITNNKKNLDLKIWEKIIKLWFKMDIYIDGREWAYKDLKPKLIVEKLLEDNRSSTTEINDYKVFCFNGEPTYIVVDKDRYSSHKRNFYDISWNFVDVRSDHPNFYENMEKPNELDEMIKVAKDLSNDFPFVRVDFYEINGKLLFGELTFYPWSGFVQFYPDEFDYQLGQHLTLPL